MRKLLDRILRWWRWRKWKAYVDDGEGEMVYVVIGSPKSTYFVDEITEYSQESFEAALERAKAALGYGKPLRARAELKGLRRTTIAKMQTNLENDPNRRSVFADFLESRTDGDDG